MGMGFLSSLGTATGGIRPKWRQPEIYDQGRTNAANSELLQLIRDLISGDYDTRSNPMLDELLSQELSTYKAGSAATKQSGVNRLQELMIRRGMSDPIAQARLMADLERSYGSADAAQLRSIAGGDVTRRLRMPFDIIGATGGYISGQQDRIQRSAEFGQGEKVARWQSKIARNQAIADTISEAATAYATGGLSLLGDM